MLIHKGTQTLETSRLTLRRVRRSDATSMFRNWASDPEVTKFLTWSPYENEESVYPILEQWTQEYIKPEFYLWMIVLKEIDEPVGTISVVRHRDEIAQAEIGYCLGRNWWHTGIMSEALAAVIRFLFTDVGMNRIEAKHDFNNPHSGGVMKKCGMRYEGTKRASDRNNQGIIDTVHYAILKSDYEAAV